MGEDRIPIPNSFYKIILRHEAQTYKAIGFVLPNSTTTLSDLSNYVCSVDSIEKITGLDFFTDLPDNLESQFESGKNIKDWNFDHHNRPVSSSVVENHQKNGTIKTVSVQCSAITKKGKRCKNTTTSSNGLCGQHQKK